MTNKNLDIESIRERFAMKEGARDKPNADAVRALLRVVDATTAKSLAQSRTFFPLPQQTRLRRAMPYLLGFAIGIAIQLATGVL